jgi:hypothetical protein
VLTSRCDQAGAGVLRKDIRHLGNPITARSVLVVFLNMFEAEQPALEYRVVVSLVMVCVRFHVLLKSAIVIALVM